MLKKISIAVIIILAISSLTACASNDEITVIELTDEELDELKENSSDLTDGANAEKPLRPIPIDIIPKDDNVSAIDKAIPPLDKDRPLPKDKETVSNDTISVGVLRGPNGIGMSYLMEQNLLGQYDRPYQITTIAATEKSATRLVKGNLDIATLPTNVAANLYQKTNGTIQLLGINTYGGLFILENGDSIQSISDLKNTDFSASERPKTSQSILEYLLKANGIEDSDKPNVSYLADNLKLSADILSGEVEVAMLSEPFVTTLLQRNRKLRIALDLAEEWQTLSDGGILPMGCIVVNTQFASQNPEQVELFIKRYKDSIDYVSNNPEEAELLIEKHKLLNSARQIEISIDRNQITWIDAIDVKDDVLIYLEILQESDMNLIGGEVPDEKFFYQDTR